MCIVYSIKPSSRFELLSKSDGDSSVISYRNFLLLRRWLVCAPLKQLRKPLSFAIVSVISVLFSGDFPSLRMIACLVTILKASGTSFDFISACFRVPVLSSDGKTEKNASADSSTSVLSEEVCSWFYWLWIIRDSGTFFF